MQNRVDFFSKMVSPDSVQLFRIRPGRKGPGSDRNRIRNNVKTSFYFLLNICFVDIPTGYAVFHACRGALSGEKEMSCTRWKINTVIVRM